MNTPVTWGDVYLWSVIELFGGFFLSLLVWVIWMLLHQQCKTCGRKLHWRWRKRHALDSRRFCPFHDSEYPP